MNSLSTDNNDSSKTKSLLSSGPSLGRIDTHSHFIPEFYNEIFNKMLAGKSDAPNPDWSVDAALEAMNGLNIRVGILSLGTPGCSIFKKEERRSYARKINECGSEVVKANPDRFGFFATIPCLTDIEGTIEEIKYALDVLNADGVTLFTAYDGQYLGHEDFKPVWEELDRRKAVVFIHPTMTEGLKLINKFMPPPVVDFPFHITRTATDLVLSNRVRENPNVKIILSQAGGFLPYAAERFAVTSIVVGCKKSDEEIHEDFKAFYYDTALSSSSSTLKALLDYASSDRILFGSDFPHATLRGSTHFTKKLDGFEFNEGQLDKINHQNALALFPRFKRLFE